MKRLSIILAVVSLLLAVSCSQSLERQIEGKWRLKSAEIVKLDSLCEAKSAQAIESSKKLIAQIQTEIDSLRSREKIAELTEKLKKEKAIDYSVEKFKKEYLEVIAIQEGEATFTFLQNNKIKVHMVSADEVQTGTWTVKSDTIQTIFDNQPAEILVVESISSSSLVLLSPEIDENTPALRLKFAKE